MAGRSGLALYSCSSATVSSVSSSSSMPWPVSGAGLDHFRLAAPFARQQSVGRPTAVRTRLVFDAGQIDLVQRHDDRHSGRLGVADRLFGLRHDAVVGRHDQHGDIGDVGPAGPHFGERLVARRIDEGDRAAVLLDLVGADVLRDAARFAGDHVDADDPVQQRRLAVVDVAQERDDRRTRLQLLRRVLRLADLGDQRVFQASRGALNSRSTPSSAASSSTYSSSMTELMVSIMSHAHQGLLDLHGADTGGLRKTADGAGEFQSDFSFPRSGGVGAFVDQRLASARAPGAPSSRGLISVVDLTLRVARRALRSARALAMPAIPASGVSAGFAPRRPARATAPRGGRLGARRRTAAACAALRLRFLLGLLLGEMFQRRAPLSFADASSASLGSRISGFCVFGSSAFARGGGCLASGIGAGATLMTGVRRFGWRSPASGRFSRSANDLDRARIRVFERTQQRRVPVRARRDDGAARRVSLPDSADAAGARRRGSGGAAASRPAAGAGFDRRQLRDGVGRLLRRPAAAARADDLDLAAAAARADVVVARDGGRRGGRPVAPGASSRSKPLLRPIFMPPPAAAASRRCCRGVMPALARKAFTLTTSSSFRLASAEPLPGIPAFVQISTSSLLSIFSSLANA